MKTIMSLLKDGFVYTSLAVLAIAGFLLFLVLAVAVRPLLIVLAVVGTLVCLVLTRYSPRFREWFEAAGAREIRYKGLRLATNIAVHPNHSWARTTSQLAVVGVDDLVQSTLGPVEAVELPPVGSRVEQGQRLFSLRRGQRQVDVRAPLSGTIAATNEALLVSPGLVNVDPFSRGWAVRIRMDKSREDRPSLFRGQQARGWFRQEIDRFLVSVLAGHAVATALPDGGTVVPELYREIDEDTWKRLTETFFGMGSKA